MKKIKNLKVALELATLLMVPVTLTGCGKNKEVSLTEVIDERKDTSSLDEILLNEDDLLQNIEKTLNYLEISEEINDLNLDGGKEVTISLDDITLGNVKNYLDLYKKDKSNDIKNTLYTIRNNVNSYLVKCGYNTALDFATKVFISNIIDNNEEITLEDENNLKLCDFVSGTIPDDCQCKLKTNNIEVAKIILPDVVLCDKIYNLRCAKNYSGNDTNEYIYNAARNKVIKSCINEAFDTIENISYTIKNNKVKQKSNRNNIDIKGVYK